MVRDTFNRQYPRLLAAIALLLALLGASAPGAPTVRAQDGATVQISGFAFSPGSITVTAGATVTWVNNDEVPHTATGDGGEFDTGQFGSGSSASITFDTPGTYSYHCALHPGMTGTIIVEVAGGGTDGGTDSGNDGGTTELPNTGAGTPGTSSGSIAWIVLTVMSLALFAGGVRQVLRNRI